jgi:ParB family chromosome partitioning protein
MQTSPTSEVTSVTPADQRIGSSAQNVDATTENEAASPRGPLETGRTAVRPKNARVSAGVLKYLDPYSIRVSARPNRSPESTTAEADEDLLASIEADKGNAVPIEVRSIQADDDGCNFELVAGHRRLAACKTLKMRVTAFVRCDQNVHSGTAFLLENLFREALCPYDLGRQALHVLEDKERFPTQRRLADRTRIDVSVLSTAIRLAELPPQVIGVFSSPAELQHRDAKPLTDAVKANHRAVLDEVELIEALETPPSTKEIIKRLTRRSSKPRLKKNELVLLVETAKVGILQIGKNGWPKIQLDFALSEDERSVLKALLEGYCARLQQAQATVVEHENDNGPLPLQNASLTDAASPDEPFLMAGGAK